MYKLIPLGNNILIEPLQEKEIKEYTQKVLTGVETGKLDVLQYGKVANETEDYEIGDVVLYEKLASHMTNFGSPRVVLVDKEHIHGRLKK